ncbi:hypothetical protein M1466_02745 [Candidatus Dependentiae bacterium]|nr:hypothetical protein [Candidatus Dependentiae bacterium]
MNTIYEAIRRVMIIAACLPMSIDAVSIALFNYTQQRLTIISTGATLATGQQYDQNIGNGYTPLLRAQNNDVIGVEMNQGISTITIQNAQGLVLYGKKTSGPFAGKWFIIEKNGSLQLMQLEAIRNSIPGSWKWYCQPVSLDNNLLTAKCMTTYGSGTTTTSINLLPGRSVGYHDDNGQLFFE